MIEHASFKWALDRRVELQARADEEWDALDALMSQEDFQDRLALYNDTCDEIELLEKSPECAKNGHDWAPVIVNPENGAFALRCARCNEPHGLL